MDTVIYRRLCLGRGGNLRGQNKFKMVKKVAELDYFAQTSEARFQVPMYRHLTLSEQKQNHPLVLSGNAFWQSHNELCIGYVLVTNNDVFRPLFSHARQRILDQLNFVFPRYINHFWKKYRTRSWDLLFKKKNLPIEIINIIINLAYPMPKKINKLDL
jgi:hypothetical protein